MRILVIGRGWTGNKVFNELKSRGIIPVLSSHKDCLSQIENNNFDWVINCAGVTGYPNVDACEDDPLGTLQGNAIFPIQVYEKCKEHGVRFAHWSSGCIYEGKITDVNADPNFFGSIYSISKGISDKYLKDKAVVFRIRMPFTDKDEPKNYLTKVRNYSRVAKLYDSDFNSLTDHDEAVRVSCDIILENKPNGPYNLVNHGAITMRNLARLMELNATWFTDDEFKQATKAKRSTCTIPSYDKMRDLYDALHVST